MTSRDNFSASDLSKDSNIERFTAWSKEIRLQGGSPSKDLPAELQQVQNLSQKFPSWIENDADSPPYSSLDPSFRSFVDTLRGTGSQVEDNDTNNSLEWALPSILQACWRMTRYATSGLPLGEADFKSIFDILMLDAIWHPRAEHSEWTQLSMEPMLSLPKAGSSGVCCSSVTPDSAFCISAGDEWFRNPREIRRAFSSLANQEKSDSLLLPHLLAQFKSPGTATCSTFRQLTIAMVSALYQRRALQHPEHFVFGICHTRASGVDVVAARWVRVNGQYARASTSNVTLGASGQSNEDMEIKFYFLDHLNLGVPVGLVRLYLMVLAIVPLAAEYRRQLIDNPPSEPAPDFEDWVDDKSKASKSQTSDTRTLARKRPRLEDPEDAGEREVPFEAIPHQVREVKRSSPPKDSSRKVGVAERKLGDIQNLPEMSSYYKCWRYVQSLPSGI